MVNIRIMPSDNVDLSTLCYQICEALRGNRGFIENDIFVAEPSADMNDKTLLISLGDDADKNPKTVEMVVTIEEIQTS